MKQRPRARVYGFRALLAGLALACQGDASDAFVVQVDAGGIRQGELARAVAARASEGAERREDILNAELHRLVTQRVVLNRAQELGVEISDDEVDERLRRIHGADFEAPDADYREQVREQMTAARVAILELADGIHVHEDSVLSYFEEHRDRYQIPARIQIRQIVVRGQAKARKLHDELAGGADFASLAQAHSLAPEAGGGGLLPPFARGEMPEVFDRAFELDLEESSEVLESPYGFHIFLLVSRFPPQVPELGDVREQIVAELETRRLEELRRGWLRDLRRRAQIRVNERLLETLR